MGSASVVSERWLAVKGHPGYEVSDLGRVRSFWGRGTSGMRPFARLMVLVVRAQGYPWVNLRRGCQRAVHGLVAEAFLGPTPEGMEVRHLDGNKRNAALSNLAYGTRSENYEDRERHGTGNRGRVRSRGQDGSLNVVAIRKIRDSGLSGTVLARELGVSSRAIYAARRRETWKHLP